MDYSSSSFDNVKREKTNAMARYNRLRKLANLFRAFEVLVVLLLFSWFSTQLPSVVGVSGKYFKKLCVVLVSPSFVFLIGNAIIVTLFVKSGNKSCSSKKEESENIYQEFVKNSESRQKNYAEEELQAEKVVFHDKQTVSEEAYSYKTPLVSQRSNKPRKAYRRTQSENIKREVMEQPEKELRRSETEKCCMEIENSGKAPVAEKAFVAKEMSNEEFQQRIEAFIAKQAKFHWEESMAIVVQKMKTEKGKCGDKI